MSPRKATLDHLVPMASDGTCRPMLCRMARSPGQLTDSTELAQIEACMDLAAVGYGVRRISERLAERGINISRETVRRRLAAGYERIQLPNIEAAMKASHERLQGYLEALAPAIEASDPEAVRAAARVESLIMDLFGTKKLVVQADVVQRVTYALEIDGGFDPRELSMTLDQIQADDQRKAIEA